MTAGFGGLVPSFLGKRLNPGDMILYSIIPAVTLVLSNGLARKVELGLKLSVQADTAVRVRRGQVEESFLTDPNT